MQSAVSSEPPVGISNRRRLYDSKAFARSFHYDGPLGALWTPEATE